MFIVPLTSNITPMEAAGQKKQTGDSTEGDATFLDILNPL